VLAVIVVPELVLELVLAELVLELLAGGPPLPLDPDVAPPSGEASIGSAKAVVQTWPLIGCWPQWIMLYASGLPGAPSAKRPGGWTDWCADAS
jgi:hypothetical protein